MTITVFFLSFLNLVIVSYIMDFEVTDSGYQDSKKNVEISKKNIYKTMTLMSQNDWDDFTIVPVGAKIKKPSKAQQQAARLPIAEKDRTVMKEVEKRGLRLQKKAAAESLEKLLGRHVPLKPGMPDSLIKTHAMIKAVEALENGNRTIDHDTWVKIFRDLLTRVYDTGPGYDRIYLSYDRMQVFFTLNKLYDNMCVHINRSVFSPDEYIPPHHDDLQFQCRNLAMSPLKIGLLYSPQHVGGIKKLIDNVYVVFNTSFDSYPELKNILKLLNSFHNSEDSMTRTMEAVPYYDIKDGERFEEDLERFAQNNTSHMYFLLLVDWNIQNCPARAEMFMEKLIKERYPTDTRVRNFFEESLRFTKNKRGSCDSSDVLGNHACQTMVWIFLLPFLTLNKYNNKRFRGGSQASLVMNNWKTLRKQTGLIKSVLPLFGARVLALEYSKNTKSLAEKCELIRDYAVEIFQKLDKLRDIPPDVDVKPDSCQIS